MAWHNSTQFREPLLYPPELQGHALWDLPALLSICCSWHSVPSYREDLVEQSHRIALHPLNYMAAGVYRRGHRSVTKRLTDDL